MCRSLLILLALAVPAVATARSEVTRPVSGADCPAARPGFAGILTSVAEMIGLAKGCIPADDPGRPRAEAAEWQHMQDVYDAWQKDLCKKKRCVSNAFAAWVDMKDGGFYNEYEKLGPLMAGCFKWGGEGSTRLSQEHLRYWTVQPVIYGKDTLKPGDNIHQVLQVKNTRTGEIHILDGWNAAAQARSAVKFGSKAHAKDLDLADAVRTHDELVSDWGAPSATEPCVNNRDLLCDPSTCETTAKVLR